MWAADSIGQFGKRVRQVLADSVRADIGPAGSGPTVRPRSDLTPRLSYGRHRGPGRVRSRRAAVAIVVYPHQATGEMCLTLTRRPAALSHHGGQVCLPGGRIEPGESPLQAALREYHEELGVAADVIDEVGRLAPIYVFASDNLVETLIVTARTPAMHWRPDPVEVDEVIEMPIKSLLQLASACGPSGVPPQTCRGEADRTSDLQLVSRKTDRIGKKRETGEVFRYGFGYQAIRFVDFDGHPCEVWGATAMLLDEFAGVIARATSRG